MPAIAVTFFGPDACDPLGGNVALMTVLEGGHIELSTASRWAGGRRDLGAAGLDTLCRLSVTSATVKQPGVELLINAALIRQRNSGWEC